MTSQEINSVLQKQKDFFKSGKTLSVEFRKEHLKKLYKTIKKYESEINRAMDFDLKKCGFETFMCETGLVLSEISYMLKNINRFTKEKTVKTPISQFPARSFTKASPYGNTLIMSPWNYPLLLTLSPLVDAVAAGNTAIIKPGSYSPHIAEVMKKIVSESFAPEYVTVITGGREENSALLSQKFDLVFFTGSQTVGKEVLRKCAENLTPAILELGGKSPCIVDSTADIKLAARRIVFGKFLNCGQTCVAPDYILCDETVKDRFVSEVIEQITLQYGKKTLLNKNYGKIINNKHFERLCGLIDKEKVIWGGEVNTNQISPTVIDNVTFDDLIMQEEIFGPLMPILTFDDFDSVINKIKEKEKPLALYIFSKNKRNIKRATTELSFGGGCINDVVIHLATSNMGFGGVGESGMGSYHGKAGFDAFSHTKSIVDKKNFIDLPIRYSPYNNRFFNKILHIFLR